MAGGRADFLRDKVRKKNLEAGFKGIRQKADAARAEEKHRPGRKRQPTFSELVENEREAWGRSLIPDTFLEGESGGVEAAELWAANPARYPHTTRRVEAFLYMAWYAAVGHGRIDRNLQVDAEFLVYADSVDIVVSNDQRFMKDCFEALHGSGSKRYLSVDEFCAELRVVAS